MSDSRRNIVAMLRAELSEEAAAEFPRLRRIPQTDIIWFLDYFSGLTEADREALLDALADSAAVAFPPWPKEMPSAAPALARMCESKARPGAMGGTRYTDMKMMCADPSMREPSAYHASWREHLTPFHFQPRPDLVPDASHLQAAKAPLVRKLVNTALTRTLGLQKEKLPGAAKYVGRCGECEVIVRIDFGSMLSQLGYTVTLKNPANQSIIVAQLCYERLWGTGGRWDYLTEENAPRSIAFFAEQIRYLANLGERLNGLTAIPFN